MRLIQCTFILLLVGLTTSCGFVKTAYNNAPTAISWWLDDYFDFTTSQNAILTPALHGLHDWHRQQQLPGYVAILQNLQHDVRQDHISAAVACEAIEQIKTSLSEFQLESIPVVLAITPLLSDKQLQYLQKKLEQRARKWQEEWVQDSPGEQRAVRLEKIEDFAEKIYGSLEASQRQLLKQDLALAPINPKLTYAEIVRRQDDVYQIITTLKNASLNNQSLSAERQYQLVKDGFERLQHSPNKRYAAYADKVNLHSCAMIAHLHDSTNAKQKQHASDFMEKYSRQFSELMPAIQP
jgi:hypothetical protein